MNKKLVFALFVSVGNIVGSLLVYYLLGSASIPEYVAVYTSIITASYTVLTESKQKTEPILRVSPLVTQQKNPPSFHYNVDIWIENIGYGIAKNIEAKISVTNTDRFTKSFTHRLLAPKEIKFPIHQYVDSKYYEKEQVKIQLTYTNEDDKKVKSIIEEYKLKDMPEGLQEVKTG